MSKPFLVHKVQLMRHVPTDNEAKLTNADVKFKKSCLFRFLEDKEVGEPRGYRASLKLRFKMPDGMLDSKVSQLPTDANEIIELEFYNEQPSDVANLLLLFNIDRKRHYEDNFIPRGTLQEIKVYRLYYSSSDRQELGGYGLQLELAYHQPNDNVKKLLNSGTNLWLAMTQKTRQSRIDEH